MSISFLFFTEWVFRHWNTSLKNESFFLEIVKKNKEREKRERGREGGGGRKKGKKSILVQ